MAELEKQIPLLMEQAKVVGLAIVLVEHGQPVWERGFGFKNKTTNQFVTTDTVFEAASLTKPVFAYTVMKLCAERLLGLDTPLSKYLPQPYLPHEPRLHLITARHILSHTPGFPNWRPKDQPLRIHLMPGERFSYSGEGYVYLQRVVEAITGQSLAEYGRRTVLEPLRMTHSSYVWIEEYTNLAAQAYDHEGELAEKYRPTEANAAYSLHTTPADFARFILAFLQPANVPSGQLDEAIIAEMLIPQIQVNDLAPWHPDWPSRQPRLTDSVYWGLGWGLEEYESVKTFWHWGDNGCFKAFVLGVLHTGTGVVMMASGGEANNLWGDLIQLMIGGDHPALAWLQLMYDKKG